MRIKQLAALMLIGCLGACGADDQSASDEQEAESVFDDQVQALEKAKRVEDLGVDRKQGLDRTLEEQQ